MAEGVGNIIEVFKAIPAGKRISFLITFAIVVGGFIALLTYTNRPNYTVLFSDLDPVEASKIAEKLRESGVKYQLKKGGSTIEVPDDKASQLLLDMASEDILPQGGSVGFEIFDDMTFGTTEFVLNIKKQQALQGELARTILKMPIIEDARVHIVPAGDSIFAEDEKPATASVVVKLRTGSKLSPRQLQGIINLVSYAVTGLKSENVSIIDMEGGILTKGNDRDSIGSLSNDQFEFQRRIEETYEKQIISMLEPVVGMNRVVAKVSVDVDYKRVNQTEENYDPDSQVIASEERLKESSPDSSRIAQGSPDLLNQGVQTGSELMGTGSSHYERETSAINYKINKLNRQTINESGQVERLSASVIIDGPYETSAEGEKTFKGYDRKQMKTFEDNIKNAILFNADRGDQIALSNVSFTMEKESIEAVPAASGPEGWTGYLKKGSKPVLNILLIALFFLIAIKPFKKWMSQTSEYVSARALPGGNAQEDLGSVSNDLQSRQNDKIRLLEATKQNPDIAADIIKTWLNEVS
ncbi:MAG: flagellar M-ring protein FliF [Deltaproteobacteria bacterium]|nr:flagellar M-ring protein FliF [Deltaproteobacteria bacterium]